VANAVKVLQYDICTLVRVRNRSKGVRVSNRISHVFICVVFLCSVTVPAPAEQTVGLFRNDPGSFDGYTLFAPNGYTTTYLIDHDGLLVHSWDSAYKPALSAYLLENGNLLRTANILNLDFPQGGRGGRVEEIAWDGTLVWEYEHSSTSYLQHHDIERLPNGNVLLVSWEYKSSAEAIAAGRDPALISEAKLLPDYIVEIQPSGASGGTIVWEWHVWDHLIQDHDAGKANYGVVADHPELVDLNFAKDGKADWNHVNAVDYNEDFDQIVLC
jgi:hypothetical protein